MEERSISFHSNEKIRAKYSTWKEEASVFIPMKRSGQNILHGRKKHQFSFQ
jgi:hypothetical protein